MRHEDSQALSAREEQLMRLALGGLTDALIADRLGISEATVSTYWGRIRTKFGPHSRTELVAMFLTREYELAMQKLRDQSAAIIRELEDRKSWYVGDDLYRSVLDSASEAILVVTSGDLIRHANPFAAELFGYTVEELTLQPLSILIPPRHREAHASHVKAFCEQPTARSMNDHKGTFGLHKSGREIPILANIAITDTGREPLLSCFIREQTLPLGPDEAKALTIDG